VYIEKADGRLRPLGIATLEDKIVQRAVVHLPSLRPRPVGPAVEAAARPR
jgi:hypothetical protein